MDFKYIVKKIYIKILQNNYKQSFSIKKFCFKNNKMTYILKIKGDI
jgi:SOS-response transcriptional repressor LexA